MRLISLVLISFIATNTVATYTPKVHQIEKRGLPLPGEETEYSDTSSSEEATETSISNPNPEEEAGPSNADPNLPGEEVEALTPNSSPEDEDEVGAWILNPPEVEDKYPLPDTLLAEREIISRIGLLKQIVKEAMVMDQEAKDQAKTSQTTSDESTTDRSSNSDLDEPDSAPEELIKSSREAPSPLMAQTYQDHIHELRKIITLVQQSVKSVTGIEKDKYTLEHEVIQNDAIQKSRVYLKELADIGEFMAKTLGIIAKISTFKDRNRLLRLVFKAYRFNAAIKSALVRDPDNPKKGRKGLVTSKEILDDKKKTFHRTAILEENEEEEEDEEQEEQEEQDDKDGAVYEQSDKE
ncbi:hypothetical protein BASA60_004263 [Batrachochytrium salamandrivorans]|nr:hypothetical protein BASA62_003689 [Batrachochytrium salamandrivorans]KAH6577027.1 hypothetical protein BASA60_004263 [Batrachochytrium salamandrivorans]KAH9258814.1 hypothetical protein BASA81_002878 [Batrachochytrium salamandrivorans]